MQDIIILNCNRGVVIVGGVGTILSKIDEWHN